MVIILYLWFIQNGAPKLLLMAQPLEHPQSESVLWRPPAELVIVNLWTKKNMECDWPFSRRWTVAVGPRRRRAGWRCGLGWPCRRRTGAEWRTADLSRANKHTNRSHQPFITRHSLRYSWPVQWDYTSDLSTKTRFTAFSSLYIVTWPCSNLAVKGRVIFPAGR